MGAALSAWELALDSATSTTTPAPSEPVDALPDYQEMLGAYHQAFAAELQAMIGDLPILTGDRVLDVACGDGVYTALLARRVGPKGRVVGIDVAPAYVELARSTIGELPRELSGVASIVQAPIEAMPFAEGEFDLAWCAQSLYSLPDPVEAVAHLARAVKPGGVVAILENDSLHHMMLPWPEELELAVAAAEMRELADTSSNPRKFYVGRRLPRVFADAGFESCFLRSYATNRQAPLSEADRRFLVAHLRGLREAVETRLPEALRATFERLVDPASPDFLPDQETFAMTCLDHVVWASKRR